MKAKIQVENPEELNADSVSVAKPMFGMDDEQIAKIAQSICVAIPFRQNDGFAPELSENMGYWARFGMAVMQIPDEFGGQIEFQRAGIVRLFLDLCNDKPQYEYLVMIDSDEGMNWEAPIRLAQWAKDIVTGVVPSHSNKRGIFANFLVQDEFGVARFPSLKKSGKLPVKGLMPIHSAGAGLLCVHRRVFETLRENGIDPFRISEEDRDHCFKTGTHRMGEDTTFCRQVRELGFKLFVDFSVRAIHYKTVGVVWPPDGLDHETDHREWKVSPLDYSHG